MAVVARETSSRPATEREDHDLAALRLECRTKPMRDGDHALLAHYDTVFAASRISILDLTAAVVDAATMLRAKYGFKAPDALHLATAVECGAVAFWTGDAALVRCTEVTVTLLTATTP